MPVENRKLPAECANMADIRAEIDRLDEAIIELIGRRAGYVRAAARYKTSVRDVQAPERFRTMLRQRRAWAEQQSLDPDVIERLYRDLVQYFVDHEMAHWKAQQDPAAP